MSKSNSIVAQATETLGTEEMATSLVTYGRAFASGERATQGVVKIYADLNTHPAFFLSPCDKQGNVSSTSRSKSTPEQYDAMRLAFAVGMGRCRNGLMYKTCAELISADVSAIKGQMTDKKSAIKHSKDKKFKKKANKAIETMEATLAERNELLRKIGPKFRGLADALITEYKRREMSRSGKESALALAAKLKEESFASSKAVAAKPKSEVDIVLQQAKNLLNALQKADNPPKNLNSLVRELKKLVEPKH